MVVVEGTKRWSHLFGKQPPLTVAFDGGVVEIPGGQLHWLVGAVEGKALRASSGILWLPQLHSRKLGYFVDDSDGSKSMRSYLHSPRLHLETLLKRMGENSEMKGRQSKIPRRMTTRERRGVCCMVDHESESLASLALWHRDLICKS